MARDSAWITVIERVAVEGSCELCGAPVMQLESMVTVRHAHGGAAQFVACSTCTRAMRRIAAVVGSESSVTEATIARARSVEPAFTELTQPPPHAWSVRSW